MTPTYSAFEKRALMAGSLQSGAVDRPFPKSTGLGSKIGPGGRAAMNRNSRVLDDGVYKPTVKDKATAFSNMGKSIRQNVEDHHAYGTPLRTTTTKAAPGGAQVNPATGRRELRDTQGNVIGYSGGTEARGPSTPILDDAGRQIGMQAGPVLPARPISKAVDVTPPQTPAPAASSAPTAPAVAGTGAAPAPIGAPQSLNISTGSNTPASSAFGMQTGVNQGGNQQSLDAVGQGTFGTAEGVQPKDQAINAPAIPPSQAPGVQIQPPATPASSVYKPPTATAASAPTAKATTAPTPKTPAPGALSWSGAPNITWKGIGRGLRNAFTPSGSPWSSTAGKPKSTTNKARPSSVQAYIDKANALPTKPAAPVLDPARAAAQAQSNSVVKRVGNIANK